MQALLRTLQDHDAGHLRIIAELWGVDPPQGSPAEAAQAMAQLMLDSGRLAESYDGLPAPARTAFDFLRARDGKVPFADMARRFGPLRRMGAGRRDREKPWRDPASPLEMLWYRGLIAVAFADTAPGPQEFAFIPVDLAPLLPSMPPDPQPRVYGAPTTAPAISQPGSFHAAEDMTTLLAALRIRPAPDRSRLNSTKLALRPLLHQPASIDLLTTLAIETQLLSGPPWQPQAEATRAFLTLGASMAAARLASSWIVSSKWNDLPLVASLQVDANGWPNDPLHSRSAALELIAAIPPGEWWNLEQFILDVYDHRPGFQRPASGFDSWMLRSADSGAFLHGFEHWDAVDGEFLRAMIRGPLHWMGMLDLGSRSAQEPPAVFRLSPQAALLRKEEPPDSSRPEAAARLRPDGRLSLPPGVPLASRYQVSRITSWLHLDKRGYHYRVTPSSLQAAAQQGLRRKHILAILKQAAGEDPHPALAKALARWDAHGSAGSISHFAVLQVSHPDVMKKIRADKSTARYLGEVLGPTSAVVRGEDLERLVDAAARLGFLFQPPDLLW